MSMTETERLREMLDERWVKWWEGYHTKATCFDGAFGVRYVVDGTLGELFIRSMLNVTPEQAIEATLGRGKCHTVSMDCFGNPPYNKSGLNGNSTACGCSECGAPWSTCGMFRGNKLKHNFNACPICGREVER